MFAITEEIREFVRKLTIDSEITIEVKAGRKKAEITGTITEEFDEEGDISGYPYMFYIDGNRKETYDCIETTIDMLNYKYFGTFGETE